MGAIRFQVSALLFIAFLPPFGCLYIGYLPTYEKKWKPGRRRFPSVPSPTLVLLPLSIHKGCLDRAHHLFYFPLVLNRDPTHQGIVQTDLVLI